VYSANSQKTAAVAVRLKARSSSRKARRVWPTSSPSRVRTQREKKKAIAAPPKKCSGMSTGGQRSYNRKTYAAIRWATNTARGAHPSALCFGR
jgi:hypothetical protein